MRHSIVFCPALLTAGFLALGVTVSARAQVDPAGVNDNGLTCFNGYAYARKSGGYRYTEHHRVRRVHGRITTWNVSYVGRDGRVIARKHLDFSDNPTVPVYRMTMTGSGYTEGIRHRGGQWAMYRRKSAGAPMQSKPFTLDPPMAGDSGFNPFVQRHFSALQSGRTIHFKFVAAGRQSVVDLKASKTGETTYHGRPAVQFTAKLDMFLINWFVSSLRLTYDPKTKRLLEYQGIGNLRNAQGKVYPVRVVYAIPMPAVARQHGAPAPGCSGAGTDSN